MQVGQADKDKDKDKHKKKTNRKTKTETNTKTQTQKGGKWLAVQVGQAGGQPPPSIRRYKLLSANGSHQ